MNHGEDWGSGDHMGSRGRYPAFRKTAYRQKSESPVTVDRSLDASYGSRGRGFRGRGRCPAYWSPRSRPLQAYVGEMGSQQEIKSQEDGIGSTKQPYEVSALKFSGDKKELLQSSASSSKDINVSESFLYSRNFEDVDVRDSARMHFDLVNKAKDVFFSCQKSVSSTSDKKVESSGVEDHENAHKSSVAGNTTIESNTRPFDLFLRKNVTRLKPGIYEINRANRKASQGYTGLVIRPGMVLLKNYLSINDQVMIVNKCRQLGLGEGGFYQPGYSDEAKLHLKMMCLGKNWDPQTSQYGDIRPVDGSIPPQIPAEFVKLVGKAIKDSQSLVATNSRKTKEEDEIPFMSPDICIVNFYTSNGRLGLHKDKDESKNSIRKGLPVVSFSVGDSAEFLYGDQRDDDKAEMVVLQSGDVLLFGGKSRNVFHGVRSISNNTAPKVLVQETSLRPGRLNLTFRQY